MTAMFDRTLLDRCIMSDEAAARFRAEARLCVRKAPDTGARVVAYVHPDGRVLIDAVRIPGRASFDPLEGDLNA